MKFLTRFVVLIYVTLILYLSVFLLLFVLRQIEPATFIPYLYAVYLDEKLRIVFGVLAGILLTINFFFYRLFSVNVHREKIIAFDNPSGRVRVSLVALEDLLKKVLIKLPDVRDVRPAITASRKVLNVRIKLALCSEVNIPDFTSKVQEMTTKKIQDIIGLLEPIKVEIYVVKILLEKDQNKLKTDKQDMEEGLQSHIPFWGYRP